MQHVARLISFLIQLKILINIIVGTGFSTWNLGVQLWQNDYNFSWNKYVVLSTLILSKLEGSRWPLQNKKTYAENKTKIQLVWRRFIFDSCIAIIIFFWLFYQTDKSYNIRCCWFFMPIFSIFGQYYKKCHDISIHAPFLWSIYLICKWNKWF